MLKELKFIVNKAMPNEPLFTLFARDPVAPAHVRQWADEREKQIRAGTRPASDMEHVQAAHIKADEMEQWRKENDGEWRKGLFAE